MTRDHTGRGLRFLAGLRRPVVAGYGRSGRAAAALLARYGVPFTVTDRRHLAEQIGADGLPSVDFMPQDEAGDCLRAADLVILSPGIDPRREPYAAVRRAGVPLISEVELGWRLVESPLVAVTGTNGKSTVTALIGSLLSASGYDARICGNIGTPLCQALADQGPRTRFVVEVSSFQLEGVQTFAPRVAVLLNITADHQDRYDDPRAYAAAKERIFARQSSSDFALFGADDAGARQAGLCLTDPDGPRPMPFGEHLGGLARSFSDHARVEDGWLTVRLGGRLHRVMPASDLPLAGPHNRRNGLAALAAALCLGADPDVLAPAVTHFRALPHRLERVAAPGRVAFVNDSKATNVDSTRMALSSFPAGRVLVILGGSDKGADFSRLADVLSRQSRRVYVLGEAAARIQAALASSLPADLPVEAVEDLPEAVRRAAAAACPGDTVLLSPACASFDAYENFTQRGDHFRALVADLFPGGRHGA
ncbi:MAG: UDP-N-acetylmuramoyl-L-alanine--D-glutamate ligase [Acidobacteriota bacterium]